MEVGARDETAFFGAAPIVVSDAALTAALERAAAAMARLDQGLASHPLVAAFLHRARLEAVRRQASVDGMMIDPWHLAAVLEGLRLRMEGALRIIDRGAIFEAARHAMEQYQWITAPDFDQEGEVKQAEAALQAAPSDGARLLAAARGAHRWLSAGGQRPPLRAALIRYWVRHRLLRAPVPLTAAASLRPEASWRERDWVPIFLDALATEAADGSRMLTDLEHAWFSARLAVTGRRRNSRAAAAIDLLATMPLISATTLAAGLGMAVKNATALLDEFRAAGLVVEVTHRSKRRLFGLSGLAPLRDEVAPPRRPMPGRGRGRPHEIEDEDSPAPVPEPPRVPLTPLERRTFDYSDLDAAMALADETVRRARRGLDTLISARSEGTAARQDNEEAGSSDEVSS